MLFTKLFHIMQYCAKLLCGDAGVSPADATEVAKTLRPLPNLCALCVY